MNRKMRNVLYVLLGLDIVSTAGLLVTGILTYIKKMSSIPAIVFASFSAVFTISIIVICFSVKKNIEKKKTNVTYNKNNNITYKKK